MKLLKHKLNFAVIGCCLLSVGMLSGCEQAQNQNVNQIQNQDKPSTEITSQGDINANYNKRNNQNNNQNPNGGGNRSQNKNYKQSDYKIDESDNIKPHTLLQDAEKSDLSEIEKTGLIQMREEEKLAHDVYVKMYEKWGQKIFDNISRSEQTHTDTIKFLLEKYNIEDPVKDSTVGVFADEKLAELYNSLVSTGNKSLVDALKVGATVEDLDIKDLNEFLEKTDNEDIKIVYQNLKKGSRNHLRAFIRNLDRNGETYEPQFISQAEFDSIISSEQERGAVDSDGKRSTEIQRGNRNGNKNNNSTNKNENQNGHGNGRGGGNGGHNQGEGHGRGGGNR